MNCIGRILAVDDNLDNLAILEELLGADYALTTAASGEDALRIAPKFRPDVVLLDLMMPGMDGITTCRYLGETLSTVGTRIVILSAKKEVRDRITAYSAGAVDFLSKPFDHGEVLAKVKTWMQMVRQEQVDDIFREAELARNAIGMTMLNVASFRDTETSDHLLRVRWYAQSIADELTLGGPYRELVDSAFCDELYRASPLHDIGKVAVDDAILRKPGPLTHEEYEAMKKHTIVGGDLLGAAASRLPGVKYLKMAAEVARHHHERFDGSGYPDRLSGNAIPLAARIVSVADVFDALTSKRVYKEAATFVEACNMIDIAAGTQFDPVIAGAFGSRSYEIRQIYYRLRREQGNEVSATPVGNAKTSVSCQEWSYGDMQGGASGGQNSRVAH
jgi:putative two-component system response regulator